MHYNGIAEIRVSVMHLCMNWQAISFDWNHARAFLAVVETGSLSAAARVLNQTQPTLGRQISAFEEELGVTLFERVGRSLKITQTGVDLADHVRAMAEAAGRMSLMASGQSQAIEGIVRIAASELFAAHLLPPIVAKLRSIAPKIEVDIVAANTVSDLLQREADIAVRNVRPDQPDLIARLIHDSSGRFYAAKSYIQRRGLPRNFDDFKSHEFVSFGNVEQMLNYFKAFGLNLLADQFKVGSSNSLVAWELVKQGLGIAPMSVDVARASPELVMLMPDNDPVMFPTWLVTHRELHTSRRIRLVFDLLAEELPKLMA
jgi:DNA-binding transcriptional LysR family regulator